MNELNLHRPGPISSFFIYKAALFAACFWAWLAALAIGGGAPNGATVVAATGAAASTLTGVVLWIRYDAQRTAADRHAQVMRTLVELSWQSFAQSARGQDLDPLGRDLPARETADVIRLTPEARQRPPR